MTTLRFCSAADRGEEVGPAAAFHDVGVALHDHVFRARLAEDLGCAGHVVEVRLAVEQEFRIRPLEPQLLHARANLRRRRFEVGVDQDVPVRRGDEVCRQVLTADIVEIVSDLERRQRRRPLRIDFRECSAGEKQGEEREEAAHWLR
jgi:hypothetical protein